MTDYDDAFRGLYRRAYRVAYAILGRRVEAEDVAQEALARAHLHWRRVRDYPDAWVARVAANLAIGVWRKRRSTEGATADAPGADRLVADRLDLVAALRALPRRQREVVVLRYLADLPEAAVADALGCSAGAVKQHASRGLSALRARPDLVPGG